MYANHVRGTFGQSTVEVHITLEERRALPLRAQNWLLNFGRLIDDDPVLKDGQVWHLRHADALAIEAMIDEAR
jgi:hypothetical protein